MNKIKFLVLFGALVAIAAPSVVHADMSALLSSYIVGGMLRHPDPTVRMQAIQALATQLTGGDRGSGIANLDTTMYIPDLYVLVSDPDPEVRDLASAALDIIMGTDTTLLRMMSDEEPLIRNYAIQIYASTRLIGTRRDDRRTTTDGTGTTTRDTDRDRDRDDAVEDIYELIALRTLLVRLKHEPNDDVRNTIQNSIERYLAMIDPDREVALDVASLVRPEAEVMRYLDDPDPQTRIDALRIIAGMQQVGHDTILRLMERRRQEQNEDVRSAYQQTIDRLLNQQAGAPQRVPGAPGFPGGQTPAGPVTPAGPGMMLPR